MLQVHVVSGAYADDMTRRLRERDSTGLLAVTVVERPGLAAIVITANHGSSGRRP